ncbi:hypothetical protein KRE40_13235 [Elizabethkingia meningoseptica]|jgi:hypothetical protein|nr:MULTISPECIES: hypothetical protein [Elizabethkingia]ATC35612.1 hypothetical protein BAZ09_005010 [Elizabethkingia anophelis R26]ATC39250.1 hypothetical protein EAAG1_005010 [Elizabethkingia anophelis Ag1]ATC42931.1 hypothetical protein CMV41_05010 [Elizabethkingia anophelis]ATC46607.1 hypothetical protein CMV40_05010 [Elizabethkingia anophelis]KMU61987.1 hypothetical protein EZBTHKR_2572 [Elizabethkingia anophelis]
MRRYKLPFSITLERKYNDINIEEFITDWNDEKENRKNRPVMIHNDLHLEMGKFKTFNISQSEIIDLGMRYALGKQEFRRLAAEVIERKEEDNKSKNK